MHASPQREPELDKVSRLLQDKDPYAEPDPQRQVSESLPDPERTFYLPGRTSLVNSLLDSIFDVLHSPHKGMIFVSSRGQGAAAAALLVLSCGNRWHGKDYAAAVPVLCASKRHGCGARRGTAAGCLRECRLTGL